MSHDHTSTQPGLDGCPPPLINKPITERGRADRAGQTAMLLLVVMFSLERGGWGCRWDGWNWNERHGKRLASFPELGKIWIFIRNLLKLEARRVRSSPGFVFYSYSSSRSGRMRRRALNCFFSRLTLLSSRRYAEAETTRTTFLGDLRLVFIFSPELLI